ncbi:lipase family protein (macronuclear) [Tetrahymena thermophila SB210]|uniref:Lipase family protein n=1 Tax=Tetrahymena thermophila (strain SB210) TaxID=312017 RepID=Q22TA4_TETTS|nr:lipase family protein [Tetrahymena thermophila SB210]EAR88534.1 lipase family protein [Tetrahymena thermophila SB210]|eukprot:XP_001008779.1 lipase family protein [Tetrahymena thermophila SB210]
MVSGFQTLRQKYPNSKVFITGHSLGAAVSAHAVPVIFQLNNNKPIDIFYNFGSPRVGDQKYASWFNSQNFIQLFGRITNGADPVVHLPPMGYPIQFYHYNHEIFYPSFKSQGTKHVQCYKGEDNSCADGVLIDTSISDHLSYFGWDWTNEANKCE